MRGVTLQAMREIEVIITCHIQPEAMYVRIRGIEVNGHNHWQIHHRHCIEVRVQLSL